jgi:cell division protein FtsN
MNGKNIVLALCFAAVLGAAGCSRQQSDWQQARETNTTDSYEQYMKKYPSGEFTAQAQARAKELYEERDWQKARDADTPEAYQAFMKQYPDGKWTEEARIRVENFTLAQAPSGSGAPSGAEPAAGATAGAAEPPMPTPPVAAVKRPAPTPPVAAVKKPAAAAPVKSALNASGDYAIQLGAFKSGASAAHERWSSLQKEFPSLLGGLNSKVLTSKADGGTLYRLQAVGLTEKRAHDVCGALKVKAQACLVVSPG